MSLFIWWHPHKAHAQTIFLTSTSTTTWSVPSDWNNSNNSIVAIGGGGGGGSGTANRGAAGGGGGGGGASTATNVNLPAGSSVTIKVGLGGSAQGAGAASYLCNAILNCTAISGSAVQVGANGGSGANGSLFGQGGSTTGAVGGSMFQGGDGASPSISNTGGSGGGGAGGPNGAGIAGASSSVSGGGNGGQGDNFSGGSSGVGGTGGFNNGGSGGNGTEWDASHGSGGGGGGGGAGTSNGQDGLSGGNGGSYGGGGGGGGSGGRNSSTGGGGGAGIQGIIVITYTPIPQTFTQGNYQWFANKDAADPDTPLNGVTQNTSTTLTSAGQAFRLRQLLKTNLSQSAQTGFDSAVIDNTTPSVSLRQAVLGLDGFPRIIYGNNFAALYYSRCTDALCSSVSNRQIMSSNGNSTSLAIGSDGLVRIASENTSNSSLLVTTCNNNDCTSPTSQSIDASSNPASTSIAIGSDGNPRIAYDSPSGLKFLHCTTSNCSSFDTPVIVDSSSIGNLSMILGSDGFARISYYNSTQTDTQFVRCTSADCSTHSTIATIDSIGGNNSNIKLGSDGFPRIAYEHGTIGTSLYYADCSDIDCSAGNVTTTLIGASLVTPSLTLDTSDKAQIVYKNTNTGEGSLARCTNSTCSSKTTDLLVPSQFGEGSSVVDSTGHLYIAYDDNFGGNINIFVPTSSSFNEQYADLSTYGSCSAIPSGNWLGMGSSGSAGPSLAASGSDDSSNGGAAVWNIPGNITATDGSSASIVDSSGAFSAYNTDYLKATNFGFNIPSDATITGFSVTAKRAETGSGSASDNAARLIKGGVIGATDGSGSPSWPANTLGSSTWGSASDLWGNSWTPADVNSSNFGFALVAQINPLGDSIEVDVDSISVAVYYTMTPHITYNDNVSVASGGTISATGNDPTESGQTVQTETYTESDGFYNTSSFGGTVDGMWDLSLKDNGAPANTTYCLRTANSDGTPLDTYSQYPMITTASNNSPPGTPTLSAPASGATNVDVNPDFTLSSTDTDSDHLKYKIVLYDLDCSSAPPPYGTVQTFDQTSDQTNWSGQDQDGGTTYASGSPATYSLSGTPLSFSHAYCWKGAAIDPLGSATFSSYSATQTFTTEALVNHPVNINGNVNIYGGTNIY